MKKMKRILFLLFLTCSVCSLTAQKQVKSGLLINGGKHVNDRRIIYTKTSKLEVNLPDSNKRLMINLDGEYGGDAPMTFENLHNHIEFYGDLDAIPNQAVIGDAYEEVSKEFLEEVERLQESEFESPIEE